MLKKVKHTDDHSLEMINLRALVTRVCVRMCVGGLSLAVEGPSKAEINCKDNKDGTCTVSYLPTMPGDYNIIVRFDGKHIPGSPYTAKITGTAPGWASYRLGFD